MENERESSNKTKEEIFKEIVNEYGKIIECKKKLILNLMYKKGVLFENSKEPKKFQFF